MLPVKLLSISTGILNRECAVRPPGRIEAVTPELAVAKATNSFDLIFANKALYKNVFPVPPGPSMKKAPGLLEYTLSRIRLKSSDIESSNIFHNSFEFTGLQ
ncbi:hypothetical protein T459_29642 [Capsicum annuum]|uniref:Uncharacterized protein n=1 Tax=Capsicum annuum TaxID=4072 RepID=A0A2G2Y635_CAPAN|nr:hypothetical protein T459_29642 [Capsicum annuum]